MSRARGFTLVEVLVSLALIMILLPVLMGGFSLALGVADDASHRTEALALAQTEMHRLLVTGDWTRGDGGGDFAPEHPDLRWKLEVRDRADTELREIELVVIWSARGRERSLAVTSLAAEPAP